MEGPSSRRTDLDDHLLEERAKAPMRAGIGLDMSGIGEDQEPACNPFGALQQGQRVRQDIVSILGGVESEAHRHGERGCQVERVGRSYRCIEDIAGWRLETRAVEGTAFGIKIGRASCRERVCPYV